MMKKFTVMVAAALLLMTQMWTATAEEKKETAKKELLIVGTSADYAPFEFYKNGEMVGFDIDLARAVAKEMGVEVEIKDMDFSALIPALNAGRIDAVISSLTPSEQRKKNVDFSDVYYETPIGLISRKAANINMMEALAHKKVGVQMGSLFETYAKEQAKKIEGLEVVSLNKIPQIIQEIKTKRIDALLIESNQAKSITHLNVDLKFVTLKGEEEFGFAAAFAKGSPWTVRFNEAFHRLKEKGEITALKKKWAQ